MFSFLKKKKEVDQKFPLSFLQTDMHAHILPGIDDGAKYLSDSLLLIEKMSDLGYRKIIATPHINLDFYPNSQKIILDSLETLKQALAETDLTMEIEAGAEYMIDEGLMDMLASRMSLLTISGNLVLTEMGYIQESPLLYDALFALQSSGYQPILAHPERYRYYFHNPVKKIMELKEKGFLIQLNILALSGYYGNTSKSVAETLLKNSLYDFCGSDVHHISHLDTLAQSIKTINNKNQLSDKFQNHTL